MRRLDCAALQRIKLRKREYPDRLEEESHSIMLILVFKDGRLHYISSLSATCKSLAFQKKGSLPYVCSRTSSAAARTSSNVDSSKNKIFSKITTNVAGFESVGKVKYRRCLEAAVQAKI
jgi:hypothetical protein